MPKWIRQHAGLVSTVGVLAAAGIVVAAVTASASNTQSPASAASAHGSVLPITLTAGGFTVPGPNPRPAGTVTFRVSTQVAAGNYFYTFRLRGKTTIHDLATWSKEVLSANPAIERPAAHNIYRWVDYTGGLALSPSTPGTLTINLAPGTYYIYQAPSYSDESFIRGGGHVARATAIQTMAKTLPAAPSVLNILRVTGAKSGAHPALPHTDGAINLVMRDGQPVFQIPATLPRTGTFVVRNEINQPAEAIFRKVAPGTTDAKVQAYFNALRAHQHTPPNPLTTSPGGVLTLSPGNSAIVHLHFPPGTYDVLSFLEDPANGVHRAYEGLHKIVVMH
jgi:hypothetical protein